MSTILLQGDPQQTRNVELMLFQCWGSALNHGPTLMLYWLNVSFLLGHDIIIIIHDISCFSQQTT